MVDRLPLDADLVARTPPEVLRLLAQLLDRVDQLEAENRDLKARLGLNSSNSSKPPSTDPPNRKRKPPVRQLLADLFGLSISTGMICKLQRRAADLLTPAYDELCHHVRTQDVHLDETGWREDKKRAWLWAVVAPLVTIFHIARSRGRDVVEQLLGGAFPKVATCDRWTAYRHLKRIQWCW